MPNQDENQDPLERLLLNKNAVNREKLAEALEDYIGIDEDSAKPVFRAGFDNLSTKRKAALYLLYRKAVVALGKEKEESEGVSSREIADNIGVNYNTLRSILSKSDFIEKSGERGGYVIPGYSVDRAIKAIENE